MATNRFNPRRNIDALQRRQEDQLRSQQRPDPWLTPEPARNPRRDMYEGVWGNETGAFTTTINVNTANTNNNWMTGNIYQTVDNTRLRDRYTTAIDREAELRRERDNRDLQERERQARLQRTLERAALEATRVEEEEVRRRHLREVAATYAVGTKSRARAKKRAEHFLLVMVMGLSYLGKVYSYKVDPQTDTGTWYVIGTPVAEVCLSEIRLKKIMLPEPQQLHNLTRFLWRILGVPALRYKQTTVVQLKNASKLLAAGEFWNLHSTFFPPYVAGAKDNMTQLHFGFEEGAWDLGSKTKPVVWENINRRVYPEGVYSIGTLQSYVYNLNLPTETEDDETNGRDSS